MKAMDILQILLYLVLLIALAALLGHYMFKVYNGERTRLDRVLIPLEQLIYRLTGVEAEKEMGWREYAAALLVFNFLGLVLLFLLQLGQGYLPFNPQHFKAVKPDLAFNTAVSFMTNTNWQAYSGETTMS